MTAPPKVGPINSGDTICVGWQQRLKEEEEEEKYRREEEEEGPLLEGKKKKGKSSKGGRRSIGLKLMDVSGFFFILESVENMARHSHQLESSSIYFYYQCVYNTAAL